jgi:primosomal protein N' (replication factor Y)
MGRFPVVLGSATPSLESWHNATGAFGPNRSARYNLWELRGRVPGTALPHTEIVDIAAENRARALGHVSRRPSAGGRIEQIGPTLERAMQHTLASDGQIILLLNRRGYANYIACPSARCGWLMQCDSCDAMMVFHKSLVVDRAGTGGFVRCHHCLAEKLLPRNCPSCQAKLNVFGAGTQRLEEELSAKFAGVPALRIDSDSMRSGRDYFQALARFARAEVKILLGTQMIAKGLDFPGVRLVGVVNADTALSIPDFRAAERTFQLVSQVAGRAGRGKEAGRVIVQTCSMNLPAIRYAANHDYVGFATDELRVRREGGLPPITKMARIVVRDGTCEKAEGAAKSLGVALHAAALSSGMDRVRIDGPGPSPVGRIADQFRFELLITSTRRSEIQTLLAGLRARGLLTSDAHTAVDIDPVSLM